VAPFLRKVKTASGATAVQLTERRGGRDRVLEHLGSAHTEAELAALMQVGRERLYPGQGMLPVELEQDGPGSGSALVQATTSRLLIEVIRSAWHRLGFHVIKDEAFFQLVLARVTEPTSVRDAGRVLTNLGVAAKHRNSFVAALKRCQHKKYRDQIATACFEHAASSGDVSLVLYDVTVRREALVVRVEVRDLCLIPCRGREFEAGGSLTGETSGRAGAALTKSCRVRTVGWRERGEHAEEVYARNRCHHLS
jgi:hypothetical protein